MEFNDPVSNLLVQVEPATAFYPVVAHWLVSPYSIAYAEHHAQRQEVPVFKIFGMTPPGNRKSASRRKSEALWPSNRRTLPPPDWPSCFALICFKIFKYSILHLSPLPKGKIFKSGLGHPFPLDPSPKTANNQTLRSCIKTFFASQR